MIEKNTGSPLTEGIEILRLGNDIELCNAAELTELEDIIAQSIGSPNLASTWANRCPIGELILPKKHKQVKISGAIVHIMDQPIEEFIKAKKSPLFKFSTEADLKVPRNHRMPTDDAVNKMIGIDLIAAVSSTGRGEIGAVSVKLFYLPGITKDFQADPNEHPRKTPTIDRYLAKPIEHEGFKTLFDASRQMGAAALSRSVDVPRSPATPIHRRKYRSGG